MKKKTFLKSLAASLIVAVGSIAFYGIAADTTKSQINVIGTNGKVLNSYSVADVDYFAFVQDTQDSIVFDLGNNIKFTMIRVGGSSTPYKLRNNLSWDTGKEIKDFYIGKTPVTNEVWKSIMGSVPSVRKNNSFPVTYVSWEMICDGTDCFLKKLNARIAEDPNLKALVGDREFRLPDEWEWEYAAGGGPSQQNYTYSGSNTPEEVAWYKANADGTPHQVATKAKSELGTYDMSGNVWEWCSGDGYPADMMGTDKYGFLSDNGTWSNNLRPNRGGSWYHDAGYCKIAQRSSNTATSVSGSDGFRLAL